MFSELHLSTQHKSGSNFTPFGNKELLLSQQEQICSTYNVDSNSNAYVFAKWFQ